MATINGTFPGLGVSASILAIDSGVLVSLTGVYVASIQLERANASGAWEFVDAVLPGTASIDGDSGTYRLRCTRYISGTVTYIASTDGAATAPTSTTLQMSKWRNALAKVRAGTGRARLVLIGDSTTAGLGAGTSGTTNSVGARAKGRTVALAQRLAALGISVSDNSFFGDQGVITLPTAYPSYDPRVTLGANWTAPSGGSTSTLAGQMFLYTAGAVNNLAFLPTVAGNLDTAIVFYARAPGNGSFDINVNGGASLATVATAGGNAILSQLVTFSRGTNTTINLVPANNGNFYIVGILAYDSTVPAVDIIQAGWSGALLTSFNIATSVWHPVGAFNFIAPDCTVVQCEINNSNSGTSTPAFANDAQAIITRALAVGSCVIETGVPSGTTNATNGTLAGLSGVIRNLAVTNNIPLIDIEARWQNYAVANSLGWMFDTLHPNAIGYQDIAQEEARVLALV